MKKATAVSMVSIALVVRTAAAQEAAPSPAGPSLTVTAGAGNSTGGLGTQLVGRFAGGRAAVVLGVGYVPRMDQLGPSGLAIAAGLRVYEGAGPNRPFLELSRGVVSVDSFVADGWDAGIRYGPVVQVGYERVSPNGLTFTIGAGIGVVRSPFEKMRPVPAATVGLGKTWRRK